MTLSNPTYLLKVLFPSTTTLGFGLQYMNLPGWVWAQNTQSITPGYFHITTFLKNINFLIIDQEACFPSPPYIFIHLLTCSIKLEL